MLTLSAYKHLRFQLMILVKSLLRLIQTMFMVMMSTLINLYKLYLTRLSLQNFFSPEWKRAISFPVH